MENLASAVRLGDAQPVHIADLRAVPLDQLPGDADCDGLVTRVVGRQRYSARIDVAGFNSAI